MKLLKKNSVYFVCGTVVLLIILIVAEPEICRNSAYKGLLLCGRIIIPSLFPFTMCVLFIMKSGILEELSKSTGINLYKIGIVLLSFIGGYPIGAKLLNEAVKKKQISPHYAARMLNFCVNAGPAFIVGAVGEGLLQSRKLGYCLLLAHIIASAVLGAFICLTIKEEKISPTNKIQSLGFADNFVISAADAASSVMSICGFVILFSFINGYISYCSQKFTFLKPVTFLTEVTNAVSQTDNLFLIAFLLGFSGFGIWFQMLSLAREFKINIGEFGLFRLLHGVISVALLFVILKIFNVSVETFSNGKSFSVTYIYSTPVLSASMLLMCIVFVISLQGKKYAGKITEDIV